MNQYQAKKLLFTLSIILIFLLLSISTKISPKSYILEELNNLTIKNKIILTGGQIEKTNYNQNYLSFYLKNSSIQFVFFTNKFIELKENQKIQIKGRLDFYKNKTQILVYRISVTS